MQKRELYFIKPVQSSKWHIARDGTSLCGKWLMTNKDNPVGNDPKFNRDDCKLCQKQYEKLRDDN